MDDMTPEAAQARIAKLEAALLEACEIFELALDMAAHCGDPEYECPMQDAHKDGGMLGCMNRARAALEGSK